MANFITHKINNLTARMNSEGGEILQREFQLTYSQFEVLSVVHGVGSVSQQVIAEYSQYSKGLISRVIFALVANDLVTVSDQVGDRRVKIITLTAKGKDRFERASDYLERAFREKVLLGQGQKISAAEIQTFEKVLDKLLAKFS